jgi:hypothetical protein
MRLCLARGSQQDDLRLRKKFEGTGKRPTAPAPSRAASPRVVVLIADAGKNRSSITQVLANDPFIRELFLILPSFEWEQRRVLVAAAIALVIQNLLDLCLGAARPALNAPDQFVFLAVDVLEIVIGQVGELLLKFALDDVPVSFDLERVHNRIRFLVGLFWSYIAFCRIAGPICRERAE